MNTTSGISPGAPRTPTAIRVDGARLWRSLMDLAQIGATPKGGVRRLALTDLDGQGRDLVVRWLREANANVEIDGAGNIFATRRGRDDAAPAVLTGSHVDTQPSGGKFDGNYGVLAGLEVLRTLNDAGIVTEKPIAVAIWTNEEGSRFVPVMGGSGAFAGVFTLEHLLSQRDVDGVTFGDALASHRVCGQRTGGRTRARCVFRGAHRAGAHSRARGQDRRCGDRSAGLALVRLRLDRAGRACRADADGSAPRCAARRVADGRGGECAGGRAMRPTAAPRSASCRSARIRAMSSPGSSR